MNYFAKYSFILAIFSLSFMNSCADPDLSAKVPRLEKYETEDGKQVFVAPKTPVWVSQKEFPTVILTDENKSENLTQAIKLFAEKDFDAAFPKFLAAAKNGQKTSHVYLGLMTGQAGDYYYPRGALSHHFEALDSGAHASSLLALARELKKGSIIENDDIVAAQYYARLANVFKDKNHSLVKEARSFLNGLDKDKLEQAINREKDFLISKGVSPPKRLEALAKQVSTLAKTNKAPGSDYLSITEESGPKYLIK